MLHGPALKKVHWLIIEFFPLCVFQLIFICERIWNKKVSIKIRTVVNMLVLLNHLLVIVFLVLNLCDIVIVVKSHLHKKHKIIYVYMWQTHIVPMISFTSYNYFFLNYWYQRKKRVEMGWRLIYLIWSSNTNVISINGDHGCKIQLTWCEKYPINSFERGLNYKGSF